MMVQLTILEEVVRQIGDDRIRYVRTENRGACAARNTGMEMAKGEIISFHDSDDILLPEKIATQLEALETHGADIVLCKHYNIENGNRDTSSKHIKEGFMEVPDIHGVGTFAILGRRDAILSTRFDIRLPRFQDFDYLIRVAQNHSVYMVDKPLVEHELSENSISWSVKRYYQASRILLAKERKLLRQLPVSKRILSDMAIDFAKNLPLKQYLFRVKLVRISLGYDSNIQNIRRGLSTLTGFYSLRESLKKILGVTN